MNPTAILHASAALLVGVGVFLSDGTLRIALLAAGALAFVAGIVLARRDDDSAAVDDV